MEKLTFEQACAIVGEDPQQLPDVSGKSETRAKQIIADHKLDIHHRATNKQENFEPDFSNPNQAKYTPWLRYDRSLGSFVLVGSDFTFTGTRLGARFWFGNPNTAREFFNQHVQLINDLHS